MKRGSWASIILVYLYGVLAFASFSKLVPLTQVFTQTLGASHAEFALVLSLMLLPTAIVGSAIGGVVDHVGAPQALVFSAIAGAVANVMYLFAEQIATFELIRILEGCALVGMLSGAPAFIMATTSGKRRVRAMALWATYPPVGFSLGLVLSSPFVATDHWRLCFVLHCLLFLSVASAGLVLPQLRPAGAALAGHTFLDRVSELLGDYVQPRLVRLVLALGCIVGLGFGTNTIFPSWFAREHGLPIGTVSTILAVTNLTMIGGSLLIGALIARGLNVRSLFLVVALLGIASGVSLWLPSTPTVAAIVSLGLWLATNGGAMATVMAVLPTVIQSPQKGASAAGLLSQTGALVAFIAPPIWLPLAARDGWPWLIALVLAGWCGSALLLPVWGTRAAPAPVLN